MFFWDMIYGLFVLWPKTQMEISILEHPVEGSLFWIRKRNFGIFFTTLFDSTSLCSNYINVVYPASDGSIWLATNHGLDKFDPKRQRFTVFGSKDGFPGEMFYGVLEDAKGYLWVSSDNGLSRLSLSDFKINNYYFYDQPLYGSFIRKSCFRAEDGAMFFGRTDSYVCFYPDSIRNDVRKQKLILTGFYLDNQRVRVGENAVLKVDLEDTKEIRLNWNHTSFSFEFSLINFINPEGNRYSYMLENFDKSWLTDPVRNTGQLY